MAGPMNRGEIREYPCDCRDPGNPSATCFIVRHPSLTAPVSFGSYAEAQVELRRLQQQAVIIRTAGTVPTDLLHQLELTLRSCLPPGEELDPSVVQLIKELRGCAQVIPGPIWHYEVWATRATEFDVLVLATSEGDALRKGRALFVEFLAPSELTKELDDSLRVAKIGRIASTLKDWYE